MQPGGDTHQRRTGQSDQDEDPAVGQLGKDCARAYAQLEVRAPTAATLVRHANSGSSRIQVRLVQRSPPPPCRSAWLRTTETGGAARKVTRFAWL